MISKLPAKRTCCREVSRYTSHSLTMLTKCTQHIQINHFPSSVYFLALSNSFFVHCFRKCILNENLHVLLGPIERCLFSTFFLLLCCIPLRGIDSQTFLHFVGYHCVLFFWILLGTIVYCYEVFILNLFRILLCTIYWLKAFILNLFCILLCTIYWLRGIHSQPFLHFVVYR